MSVLVFLEDGAQLPAYQTEGAVGLDLHANETIPLYAGRRVAVRTGVHVAIPPGYWAQVLGRSSMSKNGLDCCGGVIDQDFRGEVCVQLVNNTGDATTIRKGQRIAQLVFSPVERANWAVVEKLEDLGESARGTRGFGSTGV